MPAPSFASEDAGDRGDINCACSRISVTVLSDILRSGAAAARAKYFNLVCRRSRKRVCGLAFPRFDARTVEGRPHQRFWIGRPGDDPSAPSGRSAGGAGGIGHHNLHLHLRGLLADRYRDGHADTYLAVAAATILFLGTERVLLISTFAVLAVVLIITLEIFVPRNTGLLPATTVFFNFIFGVSATCAILFTVVFYAVREAARVEAAAEYEHARSELLLANILPATIADRLKSGTELIIADRYDEASILFADMAGFTARTSDTSPDELVHFLNGVFTAFDRLVESHALEKIKTTGDAYMVVSGVPRLRADHAQALAALALDIRDAAANLHDAQERSIPIRIGIASGPVVAGVVGTRKFFYDVWGDAVNVASRMELTGAIGKI